jgi:hypothetical protein
MENSRYLPYNLHSYNDIGLLIKSLGQVLAWKIRPQSTFTAFRALLPSANYCAE